MQNFTEVASKEQLNPNDLEKKMKDSKTEKLEHLKPIIFLNLYSIFTLCFVTGGKYANNTLGVAVLDISFFRSIALMAMSLPQVLRKGISPVKEVPSEMRTTLIVRSIIGQIGFLAYNFALTILPFSTMFVIINSAPIFTSVLAFYMVNEPIMKTEIIAIIVCFSSVLLISFGKQDKE